MGTMEFLRPEFPPRRAETDAERQARIQREAAIISQAESDIDAGLGIDDHNLERWLDALDQDENAPLPAPGPNT
jgi:hypothetical protein